MDELLICLRQLCLTPGAFVLSGNLKEKLKLAHPSNPREAAVPGKLVQFCRLLLQALHRLGAAWGAAGEGHRGRSISSDISSDKTTLFALRHSYLLHSSCVRQLPQSHQEMVRSGVPSSWTRRRYGCVRGLWCRFRLWLFKGVSNSGIDGFHVPHHKIFHGGLLRA